MSVIIGRRQAARLGAGLLGAAAAGPAALAQALNRTARLIIGFPAGGSSDVVARLYAERLRGPFAQQVVVENRSGAAGRIAVEAVKAADPDGTTILQTPASMLTIQPHVYPREVRYDALTDLVPVSTVASFPFGLCVPADHPARDVAGFAAWARAQPGEVAWASPAAGSAPHFMGIMMGRALGLRLTHVPYRGGAPALQDVVGGRLPAFLGVLGEQTPLQNAGLRIIAVSSAQRIAKLPGVPTFAEQGLPALSMEEWFGMLLPARTPAPLVTALHQAIVAAAQLAEVRAALERLDYGAVVSASPQDFAERIRREREAWGPIVRDSGFQPEG